MRGRIVWAAVLLGALSGAGRADWPQFGGPNRGNVAVGEKGLARSWPEEGPKVLWTADVGEGFGAPSIRDGKVYLLDRQADKADVLRCWDLATGKELWSYPYDSPGRVDQPGSRSQPTVAEKHVFTLGPFGELYCFDKADGKPVWHRNILKDYEAKLPGWGVSQSPVLYRDTVIVAPLGRKVGLVALKQATGEEVWASQAIGAMEYASPFVTAVEGVEQVVMLSGGGRISGLDAATGKLLWQYSGWKCSIPIPTPRAVGDGRFFITGGYGAGSAMFKVQKQGEVFTAVELFKINPPGSIIHNALLHQGHLYVKHNNKETSKGIMCLDLAGNVKWNRGKAAVFDFGCILLADGLIFDLDGKEGILRLIAAVPDEYKVLAETQVFPGGQEIWAPMAIADGKLVLRDQRGLMKCLDVKTPGN